MITLVDPPNTNITNWTRQPQSQQQEAFREIVVSPNSVLRSIKLVQATRGLTRSQYRLGDQKMVDIPPGLGLRGCVQSIEIC